MFYISATTFTLFKQDYILAVWILQYGIAQQKFQSVNYYKYTIYTICWL